jgi:lipoate-protein ligase B
MMSPIRFEDWGIVDYQTAWLRQKKLVGEVVAGAGDVLVVCEHPCVITLGRQAHEQNLLLSRSGLQEKGVPVLSVDRGGDVTLHAPGQMVVYPLVDLKRAGMGLKKYLINLEQVVVAFLAGFGIVANGDESRRGVWVGNKKIASIGIGVSRWVSFHGIGLNIATDLSLFRLIRPCGLSVEMTSVSELLHKRVPVSDTKSLFGEQFVRTFNSDFSVKS